MYYILFSLVITEKSNTSWLVNLRIVDKVTLENFRKKKKILCKIQHFGGFRPLALVESCPLDLGKLWSMAIFVNLKH